MRAGKLNKKVSIETLTTVVSTDGGTKEDWQSFVSDAWAAIEPLRGREYFDAAANQTEVDHRIRMRYRKGVKPSMRVVHKKRVFDIQSVIDIRTDGRELHLMCKEYGDD